jgi:hypothetical protein
MNGMMRWMGKWVVGMLLAALVCLVPWASPARAQTEFSLRVSPEELEVPVGTDFTLELIVEDGVDLNAFDVLVDFNPQVLTLVNWELGDYFNNLAVVSVDVQPSFLRVAATQLASEPVSGDGVLLTMLFNAKAEGISLIELTQAQFVDADGDNLEPEPLEGKVNVILAPTYTPTATGTLTPTLTFTSTPGATATITPIPSATEPGMFIPSPVGSITVNPTATVTATQMTLTPTVTPTTAVETVQPTVGETSAAPTMVELPGFVEDASATPEPDQAPVSTPEADQPEPSQRRWLNRLLWVVLIAAWIAAAVMTFFEFRRRSQHDEKEEDLLL